MGIVEVLSNNRLLVSSLIITYGNAANEIVTALIREEIETMWNEPNGSILMANTPMTVEFKITAAYKPEIMPEEILGNDNPLNNYFRIEEFASGNISFVDGLGSNTGYFLLENLYKGSTTAAHEYGHTLGLKHPADMDHRGKGVPGIMFPRGTLVDPPYQYNPAAAIGEPGSTMHPMHRRVLQEDIEQLQIFTSEYNEATSIIGNFSSIWHPDHKTYFA
ncbi:MAG: peptidase M10 [Niabella sp.]